MDDLSRNIRQLELLSTSFVGCENNSISFKISNFIKYYFTRFITNLTHAFKDFTVSEIEDYNSKYKSTIDHVLKDPLLVLDNVLFPIPKGMVGSYADTVNSLNSILEHIHSELILDDLIGLIRSIESKQFDEYDGHIYTKNDFDKDASQIGSLFSKIGLIHSTAEAVLEDKTTIRKINTMLIDIVRDNYKTIIAIIPQLKKIEDIHSAVDLDPSQKEVLSKYLMSLAYRLSIFGIIMSHIQDIEHNFVQCLDILRKHSLRNV